MKDISPSQFIEALLETQRSLLISQTTLQARKFNELIEHLSTFNLCARFGFLDLIDYVEQFEESLSYKEYTLQIFYTEDFLNKIKKYNQIYATLENMSEIHQVWEDCIK